MRAGARLIVVFLVMFGWPLSMMANEVDEHESFENGLNGWKPLVSSELVRPLPFTNGVHITGRASYGLLVPKHLIHSEIKLEVKAFQLDPSFERLDVSVDYSSGGEIKHTIRHIFEKKPVSIMDKFSWILDKFSQDTYTIRHQVRRETVSEIQINSSMKSSLAKFLEICKSWIKTTKPEKFDRAMVRVDVSKTGSSRFYISGIEFHDRKQIKINPLMKDSYEEHLSAAVKHQIVSESEPISGSSHLAKIKYQATSGDKFLVLGSSSEQSAIVIKKFDLNKGEEYLVSVDATNITGRTSPQLIVIDQESDKPILAAGLDPDIAQSGWHSFGGSFRATSNQVIVALVCNPNYKYGKYGLEVAFDNLVLSSFKGTKPIYKEFEFEFEAKGQNRYFSPLKLTNTKPAWHKLTAPEIAQIDVPVYNLNFDEKKYWNKLDNLFGIDANKIKDYGKAAALFENDNEKFAAKIRVRGDTAAHLFTPTKSWRVDFEKPKYFHGKRSINLIRPEVRGIVGEKFNFFLAKKLGLIALDDSFAFVFMNDTPYGLMYEVEHWSADILEKNRRPEGNIYAEDNDYEGATGASVFRKYPIRSGKEWKKYAKDPRVKKKITDDLNLLNNFMNNDLYEEYASLINYEKFISWSVHSALVGSDHQDSFHNVRLYFNPTDGRFEMIPWDHHSRLVYDEQLGLKFFYPVVGGPIDTNFYIDYFFRDNMAFSERNKRLWASLNDRQLLEDIENFFKNSYEKIRFELSLTPRYDFNWGKEIKPFELLDKRMRNLPAEYRKYIDQTRGILMKKASRLEYHVAESDANLEISFERDDSAGELVSTRIDIEGIDTSSFDLASAIIGFYDKNRGLANRHPVKLSVDDDILSFEYPAKSYSQRYLEILPFVLHRDVFDFVKQQASNDQELISTLKKVYALNPTDASQYYINRTPTSEERKLVDFFKDLGIIQSIPSKLTISIPKKLNRQQEESLQALNVRAYNSITKEFVDLSRADGRFLSDSRGSQRQSSTDTELERYKTLQAIKASNRQAIIEKLGNNRKNGSSFSSYYEFFRPMPAVLENYPFILKHPSIEGALLIPAGKHEIRENIIIPEGFEIHIEPGAALYLGEKVSFVSKSKVFAAGTESAPITITRLIPQKSWGAFVLLQEKASGFFSNVNFIGGSDLYLNGTYFSGMLSAHYSDVVVQNCLFQGASEEGGDDAINVKNAAVTISDSLFSSNFGDAIDFDFVDHGSKISRSTFIKTGNDGIDISGSDKVIVKNNTITASGDKGVSIGEVSTVLLYGNVIRKNKIGVVAKDSSAVEIVQSIVSENQIGIAVYNKKKIFGGGKVIGSLSTVENNRWNFGVEKIEDATQDRQLFDQRKSAILGFVSHSEMSNKEFVFPTTEPKSLIKSKKKLLKAAVTGKLKDYDYTYTKFIDYAE